MTVTQSPSPASAASDIAAGLRTFVLDTSVLLSDPRASLRFAEHAVVLPVVALEKAIRKRRA